ncbi:hypothetical protein CLV01_3339 [Delftia sp. 60]|uniref:hypothetical protein n=1 Tax=Delftia sp. 60 TaxID=2035216 RepID=UPI000C18F45F|nr:hypothetical protein [Delftia sp. 60]PIF37882.1 hypothetical protein CLU98_3110 [Burkholderiales bacterium 23]PIF66937.1 hypothetical protein CLV01_3339 [Delftia sp. 60]
MKLSQNDFEHLKDKLNLGEMTAAEANVQKVRMQRVLLVSRLTADVRRALNAAVKRGDLGHMKKDGHKPEAYFHPTFDYLARQERNAHERSVLRAISAVCG